jgi:hypothetical protein
LENLSECFEDGLMAAKEKRSRFVVRDDVKRAQQPSVEYLERNQIGTSGQNVEYKAFRQIGIAS